MITVDAWQPPGGSFQDISEDSNYGGRFLTANSIQWPATAQFEQSATTAGFLRGMLATTQELPIAFWKPDGFDSATFHQNMRAWFAPYATARANGTGYLRVIMDDGVTQARMPARVISLAVMPNHPDAYTVTLKAEQTYFESLFGTADGTSPVNNAGTVRAGTEVQLTGAFISSSHGSASGEYSNRLLLIDNNSVPGTTSRLLINGVPTPWIDASSSHVWAIVTGSNPVIENIRGLSSNDPLTGTIIANQLVTNSTAAAYAYDDMQVSTLLADDRVGGLWRPIVYQPQTWPLPDGGWGYYMEDTTDGLTMHLNDTPDFGSSGAFAYNAIYLDSGGPEITAVTAWDATLAGFTGGEALAVLLGRRRKSDVWEILDSSDTNGAKAFSGGSMTGLGYTELMFTIMPLTSTLTTDPSFEIDPDGSNTVTMGAVPNLTTSTTRYRRLHGAFSNDTTGQSITFTDFVTRDRVDINMPARRVEWDIELATAGLVYGYFTMSDPERGMELEPGDNDITDGTGSSDWDIVYRDAYG